VLALSDDVKINLALLRFEEVYTIIFYREDFLNRYRPSFGEDNRRKYISLGENFVDPAFVSLADLLDSTADLYELIQRKSGSIPEMGLIEDSLQGLKQRFPWYDNVAAIAMQIAAFLICFVFSSYALAAIFMH
jgi:hypothetical protein